MSTHRLITDDDPEIARVVGPRDGNAEAPMPQQELVYDEGLDRMVWRARHFVDPHDSQFGEIRPNDPTFDNGPALRAAMQWAADNGIPAVRLRSNNVYWVAGPGGAAPALTIYDNTALEGPVPAPYTEDVNALVMGYPTAVIALMAGANCPIIKTDPTGPVRPGQDGEHVWVRSGLRNLAIHGNRFQQTVQTDAVWQYKAWGQSIDDCLITQVSGNGIFQDDCNASRVNGTYVINCGGSCIWQKDTADSTVGAGCLFGGAQSAVIRITGSQYNRWDNFIAFNSNFFFGTLDAPISDTATSITFTKDASGPNVPTWGGKLLIGDEEVTYTTRTGNFPTYVLSGLTRGTNGTTAAPHDAGVRVQQHSSAPHGIYVDDSQGIDMSGRTDQNFGSALHLTATVRASTFNVEGHASGWHNPVPQAEFHIACKGCNILGAVARDTSLEKNVDYVARIPASAVGNTIMPALHGTWPLQSLGGAIHALTDSATTIVVDDVTGFPEVANAYLAIEDESIFYATATNTGGATWEFTGCVRGRKGSTAAAHAAGVQITQDFGIYRFTGGSQDTNETHDSIGKILNFYGLRVGVQTNTYNGIRFDRALNARLSFNKARNLLELDNSPLRISQAIGSGFLEMVEQTVTPGAPEADAGRIFLRDVAGATRAAFRTSDGKVTAVGQDQHNGHAGVLAPSSPVVFQNTAAVTASTTYLARFVPSRDLAVTKIAFAVSTAAGADDAVDVGIYDSALQRIASSGATAGKLNSVGAKTVDVAANLVAGRVYYAAISVGTIGGTAAQLRFSAFSSTDIVSLFGAAAPEVEALQKGVHPLPASITTPTVASSAVTLAVRET